ncbi:MFS transporter [Microbacterium mangrovi]|uniref:MFS transporter n=1 Tax=Microbacterium mangrovi TaxID=1348253 RepID=A0A0B2A689_9MICO|nr:MFS transporter [Microbacterium mangrovi]
MVAATLVFFVITLDAVIVNVALPRIQTELGGGISGIQWVVDGYTLMFAALLLSSGSLTDRFGARQVLAGGTALFVVASVACGLAPTLQVLIAARIAQGVAAAAMMPSSMALLNHAFDDARRRARAIAVWAMGGAVASSAGPVLGGLLTLLSWRLIFLVNLPVGMVAVILILRSVETSTHSAPFDWAGQATGILAMGGLTYGVIEGGQAGFTAPQVIVALTIALVAGVGFVLWQRRAQHPMIPHGLFRDRNTLIPMLIGFGFMIGYYGLPFVMSLALQQERGLTPLSTGLVFLPMMLTGLVLTPFTPWIIERVGGKRLVVVGLTLMTAGLVSIALLPPATPFWAIAALMMLTGIGGPFVMPPTTGILLGSVPAQRGGVASGVFNTSRQVGGALAVAVFGVLLSSNTYTAGVTASMLIAGAITAATTIAALQLKR